MGAAEREIPDVPPQMGLSLMDAHLVTKAHGHPVQSPAGAAVGLALFLSPRCLSRCAIGLSRAEG